MNLQYIELKHAHDNNDDDPHYLRCDFCTNIIEIGVDLYTKFKETGEIECEECYLAREAAVYE